MNERPRTLKELIAERNRLICLFEGAGDNLEAQRPLFDKISVVNGLIDQIKKPRGAATIQLTDEEEARVEAIREHEAEKRQQEILNRIIEGNEHLLPEDVLNPGTEELLEPLKPE